MYNFKDPETAKLLIEMQLKDIDELRNKSPYGLEYTFWEDFTGKIIDRIYGNGSNQRLGFEQAGRGDCFSVFESYSETQRRDDFLEILSCKKEYLENLVLRFYDQMKNLDIISDIDTNTITNFSDGIQSILKSEQVTPLDRAIAEILLQKKNPAEFNEARTNFLLLRNELLKPNPSWSVLITPLTWLVQQGKNDFFAMIPFVAIYMRKIKD